MMMWNQSQNIFLFELASSPVVIEVIVAVAERLRTERS